MRSIALVILAAGILLFGICPAVAAQGSSGGAYKIGDGVSAPVVSKKVEPEYTAEARSARIEGGVLLSVIVNTEGKVEIQSARAVRLKNKDTDEPSDKDYGLVEKAKQAVRQWEFKPGEREGKPARVRANIEVNFRLN